MKKIISVFIAVLMLFSFAGLVSAGKYTGLVEADGVGQMGDFETLTSGYIIYFPSELLTSDNKYPVAVWANGTFCAPALYTDLLKGVAKAGYIVVASPEMMAKSGEKQISEIDYILSENTNEGSIFYGKVDCEKIAAFGQSQGGLSSVNAAVKDERISVVVSIAGASTGEETASLNVPIMFLTGTNDGVVAASSWVEPSYNACNAPTVYASLKNGTHTSFITNSDTYINYTVKWFNAWLYDNGDISAFCADGEMSADDEWTDFRAKNFDGAGENEADGENISGIIGFFKRIIAFIKNFIEKIF